MSVKYDDYLKQHKDGVIKAFGRIMQLEKAMNFVSLVCPELPDIIKAHDHSKFNEPEYTPYDIYFYSGLMNPAIERMFDIAWNYHQKLNPHHWQFWVLIRDGGEIQAVDMPEEHIIEMLCDWSSFQYSRPGSTANSWYKENKDKMILSDATRKIVEEYLTLSPDL